MLTRKENPCLFEEIKRNLGIDNDHDFIDDSFLLSIKKLKLDKKYGTNK